MPEINLWMGNGRHTPGDLSPGTSLVFQFLHTHPLAHFPEFIAGCLLGRVYELRSKPTDKADHYLLVGAVIFLCCLWYSYLLPHLWLNSFFLTPLMCFVIWAAAQKRSYLSFLENPILILLGEASYSLYILHVPLRDWTTIVSKKISLPPISMMVIYVVAMPLLSIYCFRLLEVPMREVIRRRLDHARNAREKNAV